MLSEQKEQHGLGCSDTEKSCPNCLWPLPLPIVTLHRVPSVEGPWSLSLPVSALHRVPSVESTAFSVALAESPSSLLRVLLSAAPGDHPEGLPLPDENSLVLIILRLKPQRPGWEIKSAVSQPPPDVRPHPLYPPFSTSILKRSMVILD